MKTFYRLGIGFIFTIVMSACMHQYSNIGQIPLEEREIYKHSFKVFGTEGILLSSIVSDSPNKKIYAIFDQTTKLGYALLNTTNSCTLNGCIVKKEGYAGQFEQFTYLTIYDTEGVIKGMTVTDYTSMYGYEITARKWLAQFIGQRGGALKKDVEIQGITGATVSVNAIIDQTNWQQSIVDAVVSSVSEGGGE